MRLLLAVPALLVLAACGSANEEAVATINAEAEAAPDRNSAIRVTDDHRADERGTLGVCNFDGWSADPDPAGLNVRAAPSATSRVLGTLPPPTLDAAGDRKWASGFHVVEARNGWFRIESAWNEALPEATGLPAGWIHGSAIDFQLQTDKVFAAPSRDAPVVVTAWEDPRDGVVQFGYRNPGDCKGEWVKLRVTGRDKVERDGWVSGICGAQETSCDGVQGAMLD